MAVAGLAAFHRRDSAVRLRSLKLSTFPIVINRIEVDWKEVYAFPIFISQYMNK